VSSTKNEAKMPDESDEKEREREKEREK